MWIWGLVGGNTSDSWTSMSQSGCVLVYMSFSFYVCSWFRYCIFLGFTVPLVGLAMYLYCLCGVHSNIHCICFGNLCFYVDVPMITRICMLTIDFNYPFFFNLYLHRIWKWWWPTFQTPLDMLPFFHCFSLFPACSLMKNGCSLCSKPLVFRAMISFHIYLLI